MLLNFLYEWVLRGAIKVNADVAEKIFPCNRFLQYLIYDLYSLTYMIIIIIRSLDFYKVFIGLSGIFNKPICLIPSRIRFGSNFIAAAVLTINPSFSSQTTVFCITNEQGKIFPGFVLGNIY